MLRFSLLLLALFCLALAERPTRSYRDHDDTGDDDESGTTTASGLMGWIQENYGAFRCETNCSFDSSAWEATPNFCNSLGQTKKNDLCAIGYSYPNCKAYAFAPPNPLNPNEWSVVAPGECGCPNECTHGSCNKGKCECDAGWTGDDCSLVSCKGGNQECSGLGECATIPGTLEDVTIDTCKCPYGYSLSDCSATMKPLAAVPSLLGVDQYTDWDEYDNHNPIFDETVIAQIYLQIDPDDLAYLILPSNENKRDYLPANMTFYGNSSNIMVMENVGMRVKGGASRNFAKKSWKISFSTFDPERKWAQQKKFSLKDVGMEPLYLRERASAAGMYAMGAPAQRSSHAMVYINDELWGMYLIMEDPGTNQFLQSRFGSKEGYLWKSGGGSLQYISDDPDDYRDAGYKPMNDAAEEDFGPLANLISIINLTPDDEFEEKIQTVFDVEYFFRTYAVEVATGNWDGIYNANNFFLYCKSDGIFSYYRHDLDLSMGSLDFYYRFSSRNVWTWTTDVPKGNGYILPYRLMKVPAFQQIFKNYLTIAMQYVNGNRFWQRDNSFMARVRTMHTQIAPGAMLDYWHSLDMLMWSKEDFNINLNQPLIRPQILPPNPFLNGPSFSPFLAFEDFLDIRQANSQKQLADGPPNPYPPPPPPPKKKD